MSLLSRLKERWKPADPSCLGVRDGALAPCPKKPNCVSSQGRRRSQRVDPIPVDGDPGSFWKRARATVAGWKRTRIVDEEPGYLHAECRSLLGFVDDFELLLDADAGMVHVRSAARLGYQDFDVNRNRVDRLRRELAAP